MILSEAAKAAVTNGANVSNIAPIGSDVLAVNEHKAIAELRDAAGVDTDEARVAARDAVAAIGGRIESKRSRGGQAAGRDLSHRYEVWWVPRSAIRE